MSRTSLNRISVMLLLSSALSGIAAASAFPQSLTVDQVIEKNIAARGGLKAWRDVKSMTLTGKMDAGTKQNVQLPFVMHVMRPRKERLEIEFAGTKALQVYDGENGWKVRPFLNRLEVEPFNDAERLIAAEQQELDGYLIDHEAKATKVELAGIEPVEKHDAYKLKLTLKDGTVRHLWVDKQSFLEVKLEGTPRRLDGKLHNVAIYYRNYTSVSGLMIPFVLDTVVEKTKTPASRQIVIEKVALNPPLEASVFAKPSTSGMSLPLNPRKGEIVRQPPGPATTGAAK